MEWIAAREDVCPHCGVLVEYGVEDDAIVFERCPNGCFSDELDRPLPLLPRYVKETENG